MSEKTCQIIGLAGFIVAGVLFALIGLRDGGALVVAASLVWNLACLIWLWPLVRGRRN